MTSITTKALVSLRGRCMVRVGFLGSRTVLLIALFVQAFLAGVAAMTDPSWWELHKAWVHAFDGSCCCRRPAPCWPGIRGG